MAIAAWVLVIFEVLSLTLGMIDQYPAWSVGRSNLRALTGKTCGLANDVMVEQDPNAGMLTPVGVPVGDALGAVTAEGFGPNGIPSDVSADPVMEQPGYAATSPTPRGDVVTESEAGTEGGTTAAAGVNGSRARLPYGLDPARTPVMGSWRSGTQQPAVLRSAWYRLPPTGARRRSALLVVSAAGRFDPGEVVVQWAATTASRRAASGSPMSARHRPGATCARRWPRSPPTPRRCGWSPPTTTSRRNTGSRSPRRGSRSCAPCRTLSARQDPVLLDWLVGLAFPCQRPFGHQNGVIEVPKWRILPDRFGAEANSPVMDNLGGGPLGITELLLRATTVPTYLKDDWFRDWGALQRLTPYYPDAQPARLDLGSATRSGLWSPAPLRH